MLSGECYRKMVTASLALWRPLELVNVDSCDSTVLLRVPAVPPRDFTVSPRDLTMSPRNPTVSPRVPTVSPRDLTDSHSRAYTRGGLPAGWCSRDFSTQELLAYTCPKEPMIVFVEAGGGGAAAACARLAGSVPGAALRLERAASVPGLPAPHGPPAPHGAWRVRAITHAPPGELRLWFHHDLLTLFHIPYLSIHNIINSRHYECRTCGAVFPEPNPLKLHVSLQCGGAGGQAALWTRALATCPLQAERVAAALGGGSGPGARHACMYCGRQYSRRYGLRLHVRTHTGWRPLRCVVCARAFADPSNLNKHTKLHRLRGDRAAPTTPTTQTTTTTPPLNITR